MVGVLAVGFALATGSLALLGFGFDATVDAAASVVLVWRFRHETRAPDRAERVERIAERIVGGALMFIAAYLAVNALRALAAGARPESSPGAIVLLLISLVALPPLAVAKRRVATGLGSGALRADSILTAFAALLAAISLIGLALTQFLNASWADSLGALLVAAILAREGWSAVRGAPI